MRLLLLAVLAPLAVSAPAFADCEDGVAALIPKIAATTDPHLRTLLTVDLKQAQLDMWEFDEVECAAALNHADRLLKTTPEGISTAGSPKTGH